MQKSIHLRSSGPYIYKETNEEHISQHSVKGNIKEIPNTSIVDAYGSGKCIKLVNLLSHEDLQIVLNALRSLSNILKIPQDAVACIHQDIIIYLEKYISSKLDHSDIREYASLCLNILSKHSFGKKVLLERNTPLAIISAIDDNNEHVRQYIYELLINLSTTIDGAMVITDCGYLQIILSKVVQEPLDTIKILSFLLLKQCINDSRIETVTKAVIQLKGVSICSSFLYDENKDLCIQACLALQALCYLDTGKKFAVKEGTVKKLCHLLMDTNWKVCAASAGVLMVIAVDDEGKKEIFDNNGIDFLGTFLQNPKYINQLNVLHLITTMAHLPDARKKLLSTNTISSIEKLIQNSDEILSKAAKNALNVIQWKP